MMKTRKTISKRFRLTKKKKVLHRACGQDHFNARESGKKTRNKRRNRSLSKSLRKTVRKYI